MIDALLLECISFSIGRLGAGEQAAAIPLLVAAFPFGLAVAVAAYLAGPSSSANARAVKWGARALALVFLSGLAADVTARVREIPPERYCEAANLAGREGRKALFETIAANGGRFTYNCIGLAVERGKKAQETEEERLRAARVMEGLRCDR